MPHSDEETLTLFALGEQPSPEVAEHIAGCAECSAGLASFRTVVSAARVTRPVVPPDRVWEQIAAATGVRSAPRPEILHTKINSLDDVPSPSRPRARLPRSARTTPRSARRTPRSARRTPRRPVFSNARVAVVAAVALTLGVIGGAVGVSALRGDPTPPAPPIVAAAKLGGLRLAPAASGQADVVETTTGRQLDLTVQSLARPDGFYEVWLIDSSVTKMVPVGVLSGDSGRFALPADLDLADYPLVDVSIEPMDGNPAHSGKSVLRGTLPS